VRTQQLGQPPARVKHAIPDGALIDAVEIETIM
jgi:hypothetical protein